MRLESVEGAVDSLYPFLIFHENGRGLRGFGLCKLGDGVEFVVNIEGSEFINGVLKSCSASFLREFIRISEFFELSLLERTNAHGRARRPACLRRYFHTRGTYFRSVGARVDLNGFAVFRLACI